MAKKQTLGSRKVKRAMHEMKHGELRSGRSGKVVKSRKQTIAIGLFHVCQRSETHTAVSNGTDVPRSGPPIAPSFLSPSEAQLLMCIKRDSFL